MGMKILMNPIDISPQIARIPSWLKQFIMNIETGNLDDLLDGLSVDEDGKFDLSQFGEEECLSLIDALEKTLYPEGPTPMPSPCDEEPEKPLNLWYNRSVLTDATASPTTPEPPQPPSKSQPSDPSKSFQFLTMHAMTSLPKDSDQPDAAQAPSETASDLDPQTPFGQVVWARVCAFFKSFSQQSLWPYAGVEVESESKEKKMKRLLISLRLRLAEIRSGRG
jgi:hypothetical protein